MPYKAPALSTLIARNQADIESRLPGTYARTAFRTTRAIAYANAGNAAGLHDHLAWTSRQVVPHLADDDKLLEHCEFWGVWRKAATNASGILTVTVSADTLIPEGTRWQRPDGVVLESIDDVQAIAGDNPVSVTAIEAGRKGNTAEGVPLELISPVVNVQTQARCRYLGGGAEQESMDSLRSRLLFRVQYPPSGGNQYDYERWALEVPGVTRAWCIPRYRGHGTVGVMFVMDEEPDIFPGTADLNRIKDYLTGHINPVTNQVEGKTTGAELIVMSPAAKVTNFAIRLSPNTEEVRDAVKTHLKIYLENLRPGGLAFLSEIRAAISNAPGEIDNTVFSPTGDIHAAENEIFVLGDITWR
ncbi:putative bacteriophage protein [Xenorhabdus bovienii str. Jollieti]|uniref:Mu-like prophage FluMu protein n=1 Tax=Xenorhabdus bovienii (strain SS-2004) TaxID=406818 RepID=D3V7F2_XENBS|nr:baseplate J/gp47 family protein [Xenorhabdus bovienii]CBJ81764.1 Mu-like prophage FluMu protein [Xenorhabdus bovienii SS-2004]CDH27640.1 putative bacteriophage protein [Xenorhabdus bovienii str. Jollieti]